jgi:hypothetical protein
MGKQMKEGSKPVEENKLYYFYLSEKRRGSCIFYFCFGTVQALNEGQFPIKIKSTDRPISQQSLPLLLMYMILYLPYTEINTVMGNAAAGRACTG